ncbi:MAG: APC family permease [Bacteroidota bacterium]|jgi:APA family basic amino acid/polyamine antiporter
MKKQLGLFDCIMLIMGSMIGSGIFIVPAAMSKELQSPFMLITAWVITTVLTLLAALSYGELAALMPKAGGQYVYLKEAYNKLIGFLYGWTFFTVIQTGTIAAVAVAFAIYSGVFFPSISDENILLHLGIITVSSKQLLAITVVWLLTLSNYRGLKTGAFIQNVFTATKIGALLFIIGAGIYFIATQQGTTVNWQTPSSINEYGYWGIFCAAMVGSIFSSDAWNNVTFTGGEISKPEKTLPLSLLIGTTLVMGLYIIINLIYLYGLPYDAIGNAKDGRVGTLLLNSIFGEVGLLLMAALIMVSTFGCINGLTLSGARVYFAMANDGLFFKRAATLNQNEVPQFALFTQGIWTSLLVLSGSYGALLDYVVIAVLLFYILTVGGVLVLRKKQADRSRIYKVWGYPITPIAYIILATFICVNLLIYKTGNTLPGLLIVLAGIPVYYSINRKKSY